MHDAAYEFVRECLVKLPPRLAVLEYGGKDVNGSVREMFEFASSYVSVDLLPGAGVDVVADASMYEPDFTPDTVVCCEVLEHSARWAAILVQAAMVLDPDTGVFIMTCASEPRAAHGVDGGAPGDEYYGNVGSVHLAYYLDAYFKQWEMSYLPDGDLRVLAWIRRPGGTHSTEVPERRAPEQRYGY